MAISRDRIDAVMEEHAFFGGVAPDRRAQLVDLADVRTLEAGTVLFHGGSRYQGSYLLLDGAVHVYRLSEEGRMLVLHVIRPGESFAEVPLFEDRPDPTYPATAETLDDSTLLFFPADALSRLRGGPSGGGPADAGQDGPAAARGRASTRRGVVAGRAGAAGAPSGPTVPDDPETIPTVELDIPKSVLAAELGTVPETLSRALRSLEKRAYPEGDLRDCPYGRAGASTARARSAAIGLTEKFS